MALCEGVRGLLRPAPSSAPGLLSAVSVRERFCRLGKASCLDHASAFCSALRLGGHWQGLAWLSTEHGLRTGTPLKPRTLDSNKSLGPTNLESALSVNKEADLSHVTVASIF